MKRFSIFISLIIIFSFLVFPPVTHSQRQKIRPSLTASVFQQLGVDTDITIIYCRPGVKGRKIWGGLVPYGLSPGNKYPVVHKAHSLITITGIPVVSIVSTRSDSYQEHIFSLLDEFKKRFPFLSIAYIVLDKGYDTDEIHKGIYENYNIIPVIIRKKMVYQKGFNIEGIPLCNFGYPLTKTGIDYKRKRTRFHCKKICQNDTRMIFPCHSFDRGGLISYTHF